MQIDIRIDADQLRRAMAQLEYKGVQKATTRALNKAALNVRTEAVKEVRQRRALPAGTVRDAFRIKRASAVYQEAAVIASGRPIALREYGARTTRKGVTVKVMRSGGRKMVAHKGNKAFQLKRFGDHVYARQGATRLPIKKLFGPSIPTALTSAAVMSSLERVGSAAVAKRLTEELNYELGKAGLR